MVKNLVLNQFLTKMPLNDKDFYKFKCSSLNDIDSNSLTNGNIIYERSSLCSSACRLQEKMNFSTKNNRFRTSHTLPSNMSVPYSVVILGELNVGKSALCRNFFRSGLTGGPEKKRKTVDECGDELFDEPAEESAKNHYVFERPVFVNGVGNKIRILDVNTEKQFLESEGLDNYDELHQYLDVFDGCIVAYTLTDYSTFETAKKILRTITAIQASTDHNFSVVLVGNKCDLARKRQVPTADGIELAEKFNVKFIETSAILNENLEKLFQGIIYQIRLRDLQRNLESIQYANLTPFLTDATNRKQTTAVDESSTTEDASILPKCDQSRAGLVRRFWQKLKRKEKMETQIQKCLDFAVL